VNLQRDEPFRSRCCGQSENEPWELLVSNVPDECSLRLDHT
jgi:hypothetical protein